MIILMLSIITILSISIYKRYVPVWGVQRMNWKNHDLDTITVVDIRDYNDSYKEPILESINIPIAYLKRHYMGVTSRDIHVVASNELEKNIGIRPLRQKGFRVVGYTITDTSNIHVQEHQINIKAL